ncbi:MAG: ParB/RepB/Spo0J family partition protein [Tissierellia bacterium]|nr:ParB/RepB/Spo0J family partition protein [Tissierellia bacterium]
MKKRSLGRGLNALIPPNPENISDQKVVEIDIDKIVPRITQPRKEFDESALSNLSDSISQYGVIQPIIVKKNGDIYEIIAGERRFRASKIAGLKKIPAIIKDIEQKALDIISLIENIQREDLNPIEEANAYKKLADDYNMTQQEISKTVGKSRSYIANSLRLLKLDDNTKKDLEAGKLTRNQARSLLAIDDDEKRERAKDDLINKKINIRDVEKINTKKKVKKLDQDEILMDNFREKFIEAVGSKVEFKKKNGIYKVIIDCYSTDDMEDLLKRLSDVD